MSLQQRIHQVLHSEHSQGAPTPSDEDAVEAIAEALQKAELDLAAAGELVARLKHQLARAQA